MATADAAVSLTTCSICFETFKRPKYLPCLHTFCEECINNFIVTSMSLTKAGTEQAPKDSVNCPICRSIVDKPKGVAIEEWGKHLPSNYLMLNILDYELLKKGQQCNVCERESESKTATHWCVECRDSLCEICASKHTKYRISLLHNVIGISEVKSETFSQISNSATTCEKHPQKPLEAYCTDHSVVCCLTCVTIDHRKCDEVGTVESVAKDIRKSDEIASLEKAFSELDTRLQDLATAQEANKNQFEDKCQRIRSQIKEMRVGINEHLDKLESEVLQKLDATEKELIPEIESKRDEFQCRRSVVSNSLMTVKSKLQYASDAQLIMEVDQLCEQKDSLEKFVAEEEKNESQHELEFDASEAVNEFKDAVHCFGKITCKKLAQNPLLHGQAHLTYSFQTESDLFGGGMILEDDRVLIANFGSRQLELYDETGELLSYLALSREPWDIDMITKHQGVVTLPGSNDDVGSVTFFSIVDDGGCHLEEIETKELNSTCGAVRYHDSKIYIACAKIINILSCKGDIIGSLKTSGSTFAHFLDIYPEDNVLCFSDGEESLYCQKLDGTDGFRYSVAGLSKTSGVAFDSAGNLYVVGSKSGNIHQVTKRGHLNQVILENLSSPDVVLYTMRFKRNSNKFLTNDGGEAQIYKIS